jgi:hypothetical protein
VVALAVVAASSAYFSEYYGAFVPVALAAAGIALVASRDGRAALQRMVRAVGARGLGLALATGLLAALPLLIAWSTPVGRPLNPRQVLVGGANLAGFVVPDPGQSPLYSFPVIERLHAGVSRGRAPFLGAATLGLAVAGAAMTRGLRRWLLLGLAAFFLLLSLGPVLKVFGTNTGLPLPYAVLARVPPFTLAREPLRLSTFAAWALLGLAALGLTAVRARVSRRFGRTAGLAVVGLATAVWMAEGYSPGVPPARFVPPPGLATLPPGAVVDLPLTITDGLAMFLQIYHGRPIVTGYVSRVSAEQFEHVRRLQDLIDTDPGRFVAEVRGFGVRTAILHPGATDAQADALAAGGLRIVDLRDGPALEPVDPPH